MTEQDISRLLEKQRRYFYTGATLDLNARLGALEKLKNAIKSRESLIHAALKEDLGKSSFESYMCETGLVLSEISYMQKHLTPEMTRLARFQFLSFFIGSFGTVPTAYFFRNLMVKERSQIQISMHVSMPDQLDLIPGIHERKEEN